MKIKELIKVLQGYNPEREVLFSTEGNVLSLEEEMIGLFDPDCCTTKLSPIEFTDLYRKEK